MVSSRAATVEEYLAALDPARRETIGRVRDLVNRAMPEGYREQMSFGMIGWVVPLEDYPDTYNGQPLGYAALAAQKNYNALYLTCVYASDDRKRALEAAATAAGKKLDMGKSCIRFREPEDLPLDHILAEIGSVTPAQFIARYETIKPPR